MPEKRRDDKNQIVGKAQSMSSYSGKQAIERCNFAGGALTRKTIKPAH